MSGWQTSDRRSRLPVDWEQRRQLVLARDGHRCQWVHDGRKCGWKATDVDHRRPGDDDSTDNLQALCGYHHKRKSSSEGARAGWDKRAAIRERFARQPEPHPGSLA